MNCKHWIDCGVNGGGCCRLGLYGGRPSLGVCKRCPKAEPAERPATVRPSSPNTPQPRPGSERAAAYETRQTYVPASKSKSIPEDQWPRVIKWIARKKTDQDKGVGDTVARTLGKSGEIFKRVFKSVTGEDCGCGARQERLNAMYPYK